ncbi:DUF4169 family protein [Salinarimonas sp. NSM]|uniref:DUF4169 family protein n=1 Tax=Salinarimonas sp. NSM TaxID=3458003 RepID=UPI00403542E0
MSAEIVNLRRARKAKARTAAEAAAAENRVLFGRTKAQRTAEAARDEQDRRRLEGHRRETEGGAPPPDETP